MNQSVNLPWTSFTGRMREIERVVRAMPDVGAPAFRLLTAITQGLNEGSGQYHCRDELMMIACGLKSRQSISSARSALARKKIIEFTPGRPGKATIYRLAISDDQLLDHLAMLTDQKLVAKMKADSSHPRRIGVKESRRKATKEVGPGEAAIDALRQEIATPNDLAGSRHHDAETKIGVKESRQSASRILDALLPEPTPSSPSTDAEIGSVVEQASEDWVTAEDRTRAETTVSKIIRSAASETGFSIEEAGRIIADELAGMKRSIAEFPGDSVQAARRIRTLLTEARDQNSAA